MKIRITKKKKETHKLLRQTFWQSKRTQTSPHRKRKIDDSLASLAIR